MGWLLKNTDFLGCSKLCSMGLGVQPVVLGQATWTSVFMNSRQLPEHLNHLCCGILDLPGRVPMKSFRIWGCRILKTLSKGIFHQDPETLNPKQASGTQFALHVRTARRMPCEALGHSFRTLKAYGSSFPT